MPDEVNVWVALKNASSSLELTVWDNDAKTGTAKMTGTGSTIALGVNLHVACIRAKPANGAPGLDFGKIYYYNLKIGNKNFSEVGQLSASPAGFKLKICYGNKALPSFCLPGKEVKQLKIAHGSCRKPHAPGTDGFVKLDKLLKLTHDKAVGSDATDADRPQMLLLTGDQIYADDVDPVLMHFLRDAASTLLGWEEALPNGVSDSQTPGNYQYKTSWLADRRDLVTKAIGFTASYGTAQQVWDIAKGKLGLDPKGGVAKNHLFKLGEFYAMYLFAWSDTLWPPDAAKVARGNLAEFRGTIDCARRVMANVPTYMMFDDHDVTDDWFFDKTWCEQTLHAQNAASRHVLTNALTAFAMFQMWGNLGPDFAQRGGLKDLPSNLDNKWPPDRAWLEANLLPKFLVGSSGAANLQNPITDLWNFRLEFDKFRIIFLDTRTERAYPNYNNHASLINPLRIPGQLASSGGAKPLTIVVSPAPVFETEWKESTQDLTGMTHDLSLEYDLETWKKSPRAFSDLLQKLADFEKVVILSGDVHYGFSTLVRYWGKMPKKNAVFLQLCSSALKNCSLIGGGTSLFASAMNFFDSGNDEIVLTAKLKADQTVELDDDHSLADQIWQLHMSPTGDARTFDQRGFVQLKPQDKAGEDEKAKTAREAYNKLAKELHNRTKHISLYNNCAVVRFPAGTSAEQGFQILGEMKSLLGKMNLTRHTLSLAVPVDADRPIKS